MKVKLKPSYAKWHLDHPEIYEFNGEVHEAYEVETLLHLMCCMGVPVYGKILKESKNIPKTYKVKFRVGRLSMSYWVERPNIIAVKK